MKFHDGTVLTAKDVAYTLDGMKKLGVGAASLIEGYASTTVTDDTHLVINLDRPSSVFLGALSKVFILNSAMVSANAGDNDGQAWPASQRRSGPFKLVSQPGQDLTVERVADYWDFDPKRPEAIVFRRVDSATGDEIRAGNVDVAIGITDRDAAGMTNDQGIQIVSLDSPLQAEVIFNTRTGPTADPKVRKALRMVYDYEGGLRSIRMGNGTSGQRPAADDHELPARPAAGQAGPRSGEKNAGGGRRHQPEAFAELQPAFEWQKTEATLLQSEHARDRCRSRTGSHRLPELSGEPQGPEFDPANDVARGFRAVPDPGVVLEKGYKSDAIGTNYVRLCQSGGRQAIDEALASGDEQKRCEICSCRR